MNKLRTRMAIWLGIWGLLAAGATILAQGLPPSWVFYDGFERTPGVNFIPPWTEVRTIGGTQAITATRPYAGAYSREVHHTSADATEIMLHAAGFNWGSANTYYMRFYMYFDTPLRFSTQRKLIYQDPGDNTRVNFYIGTRHSGGDGWGALPTTDQATLHIRNDNQSVGEPAWNGPDTEQLDGWYGSPGLVDSTPIIINLGRWYCIEVMVRKSTTDGEIRVWLDGVEKIRFNKQTWGVSSYNTGSHMPGCLELMGFFNWNPNHNGEAEWFDEVVIATSYIGPIGTPPPGPSGGLTNFTAAAELNEALLSWQNPSDTGFVGTMLRMGLDGYPDNPNAGTLVSDRAALPGSTDTFLHTGLSPNTPYYYSAFTYNSARTYADPVHLLVVTKPPKTKNLRVIDQ
jgi:hypothetical protein